VYDLTKDKLKSELPSKNEIGIRSLSIAANAKFLISCDSAGYVYPYYLEDTEHLVPSKPFQAHEDYILKVQIAQNNKHIATCSADKKIHLWTLKPTANERDLQFELSKTLKGHNKWVWDCDFSCDSAYLISASTDATVRLWDVESGEIVQILKGHSKGIVCLALNDVAT
jgi:G protein beta subunit-like protein